MSDVWLCPYMEAFVSRSMHVMARAAHANNCGSLMTDNTFYMGLGPNYTITTIFGLKNKLGGGGGLRKWVKNAKIGLKTCFFALRPRNRKTSYFLRRKNAGELLNGPP